MTLNKKLWITPLTTSPSYACTGHRSCSYASCSHRHSNRLFQCSWVKGKTQSGRNFLFDEKLFEFQFVLYFAIALIMEKRPRKAILDSVLEANSSCAPGSFSSTFFKPCLTPQYLNFFAL